MRFSIPWMAMKVRSDKYSRIEAKSRRRPPYTLYALTVFCFGLVIFCVAFLLYTEKTPASFEDFLTREHDINLKALLKSWFSKSGINAETSTKAAAVNEDLNKVISCYYNTPMPEGARQLRPSAINPHLCTHINVAFAGLADKQIHLQDHQVAAIKDIVKLKKINPDLKILLSVGGAGNNNGFSDMVVDHASRKVFIKSIKYTLRNLTLDGIDLDWEFPAVHSEEFTIGKKGKHSRERQHFSQLLREIRAEFIREKRNYLLTVAVAAPQVIIDAAYDVDQINLYTDFVNIMSYDYHIFNKITPFTGLNSPLYPRDQEKLYLSTLNINYTVNTYKRKGLDRNKIVVGIPTYGHSFQLRNSDNPTIGSPVIGYGTLGSLGFVNFPEICRYIEHFHSQVTIVENSDAKVPYFYRDHEWVSYDSTQSVMEKAKYIKENNLRGAMIYCLNSDDYEGVCERVGSVRFPLSYSVKNTLVEADAQLDQY